MVRKEALLFAITSFPGFTILKLTELEIMLAGATWKWRRPRSRLGRGKVKVVAPTVAIMLTLVIFGLQWFSPWPVTESW